MCSVKGSGEAQLGSAMGDSGAGASSFDRTAVTADSAVYQFSEKHRWDIRFNFMSGVALPGWISILRRHWRHVEWLEYGHRVLFLTLMACINSLLGWIDWLRFARQIASQGLHEEPVIILGHPRTGTTHLHNLLALDPRFAYVSTFQAGCPQFCISVEPFKWLWSPLLPRTRPMDAMALSWDVPAEDELVTTGVSGGISPYMAIVFPREEAHSFRDYYAFQGKDPAHSRWEVAFLWIMRKATFAASHTSGSSEPKPLVIKSPVHTARVALLLRLFPKAQFLYIHRNPYEVFQSAAHMADTYYWYTYLQRPNNEQVQEFILTQYELLYEQYTTQRHLIPAGRLMELSFTELEAAPLVALERIYKQFGWTHFDEMRPRFERYCANLSDFRKNQHRELSQELKVLVRQRWGHTFAPYGYKQ